MEVVGRSSELTELEEFLLHYASVQKVERMRGQSAGAFPGAFRGF